MSLVAELKRRNVFRVGAAYLVLAWVVVQVLSTLMPIFGVPEWTLKLVVMLGALGFPCVLLFSWVYELTPDGLKRESEVDRSRSITNVTAKRLDYITIGLLVAAIAVTALDRFTRNPEPARTGSTVGAGHARDTGAGATESAAEDSRGHGPLPQQATVGVPAPDDKSIAVLPFVNISDDKANEYFSDGISEELLNLLAKVPELKVIARTSSFSFKGEKIDIPTVAAKLHVAHVLEGSVRKAGNKVRVTAQLIRTDDSTHLWSETYDRSLDDIFAVQDEIAAAVVAQLKITLLGEAPKAREVDPHVYTMYLQGRALGYQFTQAGYEQSIELLQQALKIDPSYAPAWRMLAVNYNNQAVDGFRSAEDAFRLSSEAVGKALAADPNYAAAYSTLSATLQWNFDVAGCRQHGQLARQPRPARRGYRFPQVCPRPRSGQRRRSRELGRRAAPCQSLRRVNHGQSHSAQPESRLRRCRAGHRSGAVG
jgi:adenylate cyclase